ncbi:geranylgeranyl diphosphate synthase [Fusarium avenaceum]|nr:geranylgeranyl diphosphate synthase [Fusarium avenaceum]
MIEQPVSNLLPVCESFQSVDIMDATACASDKFPPTDTPPDSTFSDEGSECGEELPTENSTFYSPVTPESISQVCVSTAMNSENQHEWVAKRLLVAESPHGYILTLPSKGIRGTFIDALNIWFEAPEDKTDTIKEVIDMLHNSSLMIDDFQDNSPLRRGKPSAHSVFGPAQAINSATYIIVKAIDRVQHIASLETLKRVTATLLTIFEGQAMDLSWTFNNTPPSIQNYLLMINDKTGALFRLACELLVSNSQIHLEDNFPESINRMVSLIGQYFQIRDDYQNLTDLDYADKKGFCEDLDEGKYSLPLIHALQSDSSGILTNMLSMRRTQGCLTPEQKALMLNRMEASGSLEWTRLLLNDLHQQMIAEIRKLEEVTDRDNPALRALVERLRLAVDA